MAVRFIQRYCFALILLASLSGNVYQTWELHWMADKFVEHCCEPYPGFGCVDVETHVCEDEDTWSKAMMVMECYGESEAAQEFKWFWQQEQEELARCNDARKRCELLLNMSTIVAVERYQGEGRADP